MKLEHAAAYMETLYDQLHSKSHPELVRRIGVTMLNVAGRGTPPNPGGLKNHGKKAVKALKERIEAEVGIFDGQLATAIPTPGGAVAFDHTLLGWGGYRFVEPRDYANKVRFSDPAAVLKKRVFRRAGNVVRARNSDFADGIHWVRRSALMREVNRLCESAGSLISSWLPAARGLKASNADRDFDLAENPRPGKLRLSVEKHRVILHMVSDWGNLIVGRRFLSQFDTYIRVASRNAIRRTEEQFWKNVVQ